MHGILTKYLLYGAEQETISRKRQVAHDMTPAVDIPIDYVPSDVQYLLNEWRPRRLHVLEDTTSKAAPPPTTISANTGETIKSGKREHETTRPAGFYDKHLAKHLVLKQVKTLGSLVDSLVGIVDKAIKDAYAKGPLPPNRSGSLRTKGQIQNLTKRAKTTLRREEGVTEYYQLLTATFCLPIASTLALYPTLHEWTSLLGWTLDSDQAGWAFADGVLQLTPAPNAGELEDAEDYQLVLEKIDPDIRHILDELQRRYPDLANWEMRFLAVGDDEVMKNIAEWALNAERFRWIYCGRDCKRPEAHKDMFKSEDEFPKGYDALQPPWTLDPSGLVECRDSPSSSRRRSGHLNSRPSTSYENPASRSVTRMVSSELASCSLSSEEGHDCPPSKGTKRKRTDSDSSYQDDRRQRRYVDAQLFLQQVSSNS
jgi:hypothetical protein